MKYKEAIKLVSEFTKISEKEIEDKIKNKYFKSFKTYKDIEENSFCSNMFRKYKDNLFLHYNDIEYVLACLFFYKISCRSYINILKNRKRLFERKMIDEQTCNDWNNTNSIIDLGAGIGLSTFDLSEEFINSEIYYHNLKGNQFDFAEKLLKDTKVELIENYDNIGNIDIILAFDYFEHFENPIEELRNVIEKLQPKYIIESSDFSHAFIGHYENYIYNNERIHHKKFKKIFNTEIEKYYKLHPVSDYCWNKEPRVWVKK
jgi:2-polyprenyl-3-methyl-5-hydroxy-6-metoxy-1,4-benzoquinol methylase